MKRELLVLMGAALLAAALPAQKRESVQPPPDDVPVNRTTINHDIVQGWIETPDSRGTWDILSNCVFTLGLCVFTAIHLNVGPDGQTERGFWLHKCKWVIIAIFAPELVLYSAGKQWFSAQRLCKKLNRWRAETCPDELTNVSIGELARERSNTIRSIETFEAAKTERYQLIFGWYSVMGGFIVDVSHLHNTLSRLTITPKGVAFLAKHGHFLVAPVSTIRDKSKADILAKGLVCFQVGWLLFQTISRKVVDYPITLLELHVLVHCFCALGMYGLWFHKPLDVRDPTWVDCSGFEDLLALMLVRNYGLGGKVQVDSMDAHLHASTSSFSNGAESAYIHARAVDGDHQDQEVRETDPEPLSSEKSSDCIHDEGQVVGVERRESDPPPYTIEPPPDSETVCTLVSGQSLKCGFGPAPRVVPKAKVTTTAEADGKLKISLTSKDIRRWTLASEALRKTGDALHKPQGSVNFLIPNAPNIFLDRKGVHAGFFSFFCSWASGGLIAALVLCVVYGAIHALAWNFQFPSTTEHLLWRLASVDTMGGTVTGLSIFSLVVYLYEHDAKSLWTSIWAREPGILSVTYRALVLLGLLNLPLFLLSRVYIVVESFISLRQVPIGVYDTVQWTQYIPHI